MDEVELRDALVELSREAKLEVRWLAAGSNELVSSSAVCRVREAIWVVLAASDPLAAQISVLVEALRAHAGELLAGRYLPPAIRELLGD